MEWYADRHRVKNKLATISSKPVRESSMLRYSTESYTQYLTEIISNKVFDSWSYIPSVEGVLGLRSLSSSWESLRSPLLIKQTYTEVLFSLCFAICFGLICIASIVLCCIRLKIKVLLDSNIIKKCAGEKADVFVKYMSCVVFSK